MGTSDPAFPYAANNAYNRYTNNGAGVSPQTATQNLAAQSYTSPLINFQRQALPDLSHAVSSATYSARAGLSNGNGSLASYMSSQTVTSRAGDNYASSSSSSHVVKPEYPDITTSQVGLASSGSSGMYQPAVVQHASIRELSRSPDQNDIGHESATSSRESNSKPSLTPNGKKSKATSQVATQPYQSNNVESADDSDTGRNGSANGRKQKLTRIHQACINCGAKKQKCTGGNPCDSCKSNGLECAYKASRKR